VRWRQLRRLSLKIDKESYSSARLPLDPTIDFITKMTHLTHLHLDHVFAKQDTKVLRDKVNEVIVPTRPGFVLEFRKVPWAT
jgi:hypothetical protein